MDTWKNLLREALRCLATLEKHQLPPLQWTIGGGTMLMLRHQHRLSRDIDLFLVDVQYLTYLSPRLNEAIDARVSDYIEQSATLKLVFDDGDVDFIVAPSLLGLPAIPLSFDGQTIRSDHSAEIVAKKLFYRSATLKVRDVLDLALVLEQESGVAELMQPVVFNRRD